MKVNESIGLQEAAVELRGETFKLWVFIKENGIDNLKRKKCEEWGIKKDCYYEGIRKLKQKGYIE